MRRLILLLLLSLFIVQPVYALELEPPDVPEAGSKLMPVEPKTFGDGLLEILQNLLPIIRPDLAEALKVSTALIASVMMVSITNTFSASNATVADAAGVLTIALILFRSAHSMIQLGNDTVEELAEYEKLLLPILTAALAAHGGISTSTALYAGTAFFNTFLSKLICTIILPMIYCFLAISVVSGSTGEKSMAKLKELMKNSVHWSLRTILSCFTGYMSITGVVSGKADAAALRVARSTISTVVPVVGGILSDASEAVLIGAELVKNSIGIYGIYAILAVFLGPFVQIGVHYLVLKYTASICSIFGSKSMCNMIDDFSSSMGLLLGITGAVCLLMMISCICFLKGMG